MEKEDLINWMKFCKIHGIGSSKIIKLLGIFGSFNRLYNTSEEELFRTRIFNERMILEFREIKKDSSLMEKFILDTCDREDIKIIPLFSKDYPSNLKNLSDAPLTLYAQGDLNLLRTKKIAIVGSRESEKKSLEWARNLSKDLIRENITIISGGAIGIDYSAHKGALDYNGKTICVVGTGLLVLYPPQNREMFKIIKEKGLLLSEHPPLDKGGRLSLLRRNRIISGLSEGIVIITSAKIGGSRTQIEIAHKQRIQIFVPKISLSLKPNEGIEEVINNKMVNQIEDYTQILDKIKRKGNISIQKTL